MGVVISTDFGSGWSTWGSKGYPNDDDNGLLSTDRLIVWAVLDGNVDGAIDRAREIDPKLYVGSNVKTLTVEWIPLGAAYRICEHDGAEWIELRDDIGWVVAE